MKDEKKPFFAPELLSEIDEKMLSESESYSGEKKETAKPRAGRIVLVAVLASVLALLLCGAMLAAPFLLAGRGIPGLAGTEAGSGAFDPGAESTPADSREFVVNDGRLVRYQGSAENVILPDDVTAIDGRAFADAVSVKTITLPEGVTEIGDGAFTNCPNLETVLVTGDGDMIERGGYILSGRGDKLVFANKDCDAEHTLIIPEGTTTLRRDDIVDLDGITRVILPSTMRTIRSQAFFYACEITELCLGGTRTIEKDAFWAVSTLRRVDCGKNLRSIGSQVFENQPLEEIRLPASMGKLEFFTFGPSLKRLVYEGSRIDFQKVNNFGAFGTMQPEFIFLRADPGAGDISRMTYVSNGNGTCTINPSGYESGDLVIPEKSPDGDTVTAIGSFEGNTEITSVTLPASVKTLPDRAFRNCSELTSVSAPGTEKWGRETFYGCRKLTSCPIPAGLKAIPESAFYDTAITSAVLPEGLSSIGKSAFWECFELTQVSFPSTLKELGESAFYNCRLVSADLSRTQLATVSTYAFNMNSTLTSVRLPAGVKTLESSSFGACEKLTAIDLPEGLTSISGAFYASGLVSVRVPDSVVQADNAFSGCSNLEEIVLGRNLTDVSGIVRGCGKLRSIVIPEKVTVIGDYTFENCTLLENITLPEGITSFGRAAFAGCTSLTSIVLPAGTKTIGSEMFSGCTALASVTLPAGIREIPNACFLGCTALTAYAIPENVVTLGGGCFSKCTALTTVRIPDGVTEIPRSAFEGCSSLTDVIFGNGVIWIREYAFMNCPSLMRLQFPDSLRQISNSAFASDPGLTEIVLPRDIMVMEGAFSNCIHLKTVTFCGGQVEIMRRNFDRESQVPVEKIVFADDTVLGRDSAFQLNPSLSTVVVEKSLTLAGYDFFGCENLSEIDLSRVTAGESSFQGCTKIK